MEILVIWPAIFAAIGAGLSRHLWYITRGFALLPLGAGWWIAAWEFGKYENPPEVLTMVFAIAVATVVGLALNVEKIVESFSG